MEALFWILIALALLAMLAGIGLAVFTARTAKQIEAALPAAGHFVDIAGGRIHYVEKGEGRPIVMIHGLGGNLQNFTHSLFERLSADYRLVALDRPGAGYSVRHDDAHARLRDQARMVKEFLDAKGIERPLIVGHSLGGAVALALALDHPERVAGLALLAPLTHHREDVPELFQGLAIRSPFLRRLVGRTLATPLAIRNGQAVLATVFGPNEAPKDFATRGGGLLGLRPKSFYATSTDLMAVNHDLPGMEARYSELAMPVGILYGAGDRVIGHRENGQAMKDRLPALDYETHEDLGHMIQISRPDETAAFVCRMAQKAFAADKATSAERQETV